MPAATSNVSDTILEWWHILLYLGTLFIGFILGTAKQRWNQEQLQARVQALEARLSNLEQTAGLDSRTLLVVQNELTHIRSALGDIKIKLEALS